MRPNLSKASILILLISLLTAELYPTFVAARPDWLSEDLYLTYEQAFSWPQHSETTNMTWKITNIEGNYVHVETTSYTINDSLNIIPVSGNFTVNTDTREITESTEPSIVGYKWFYWIETNVTLGQTIDTGFGNASISRSEDLNVLGQQRGTWVVEHNWTPTTNMKRWYDKATGIVLKIQVSLQRADTQIQATETAKWTNINLPPSQPSGFNLVFPIWIWLAALVAMLVASLGIAVTLMMRRRNRNQTLVPTSNKRLKVENPSHL